MKDSDIVLCHPVRTAIGKFGGSLKDIPAADLGARVIGDVLRRSGVAPDKVSSVVFGNVIQAGTGMNPARQATLNGGLPEDVSAMTVNGGMRKRGFGRIINISSVNAARGQMGQTNYCAAKAGVEGFTRALARESAAKGITVNAIAPGYADTAMVEAVPDDMIETILDMVPMSRMG